MKSPINHQHSWPNNERRGLELRSGRILKLNSDTLEEEEN